MMKNTQSHVGETSAFILPSPSSSQQGEAQQEHQQSSSNKPTTTPLHPTAGADSVEGFSSPQNNKRSPSLPWLVEYWSSSLCRAPEMVFDNLCSCQSTVDPFDAIHTSSSTISDKSSSKNSYFDDTILRSDPKVDRSPTKISPTRWEDLRAVVASHGDFTIQDHCKAVESMTSIEETTESLAVKSNNNANSIYPTKLKTRSLMDDTKDDEDEAMGDDDIRDEPNSSEQNLQTCQSFDHFFVEPSKRFLCSSPSTPPHASMISPPLSPPTTRLPERRRNRQTSHISPRTLGFQMVSNNNRSRLTPPSPAPSADTYTTISLSHSFAREFDEGDDDFELLEPMGGNLYLDRLAAETITYSPSRSPFRRLQPRTSDHDDEKKEEENRRPSTPTKKRTSCSGNNDNDERYRCLVRMSPDNYKHGKTSSSDLWADFPKPEETESISSISSSVLLPLHPHQRIIEPLSDMRSNGYSFFRDQLPIKRRITTIS